PVTAGEEFVAGGHRRLPSVRCCTWFSYWWKIIVARPSSRQSGRKRKARHGGCAVERRIASAAGAAGTGIGPRAGLRIAAAPAEAGEILETRQGRDYRGVRRRGLGLGRLFGRDGLPGSFVGGAGRSGPLFRDGLRRRGRGTRRGAPGVPIGHLA